VVVLRRASLVYPNSLHIPPAILVQRCGTSQCLPVRTHMPFIGEIWGYFSCVYSYEYTDREFFARYNARFFRAACATETSALNVASFGKASTSTLYERSASAVGIPIAPTI
jgi:hypothetical protein